MFGLFVENGPLAVDANGESRFLNEDFIWSGFCIAILT